MKLKKEPKEVDFVIKSEPWTDKDLAEFRNLMQEIKLKNRIKKRVKQSSKNTNAHKVA